MPYIREISDTHPSSLAEFDAVIDVRSPAEFAEDHVPGAINLPVLDNEERARVGTIYVQESRFRARRLGAALVARNVARHLEGALAGKPDTFRPLVYCWRGGQRSGAMATILAQVGWRTSVIAGGYKTYRRRVNTRLYDDDLGLRVVLIDGCTGTGKTGILRHLSQHGVQTIDLEDLASHRGSVFGALPGKAQPSQRLFESKIVAALDALDPARPIVMEAEGAMIGARNLPASFWKAMAGGTRIFVSAPMEARARYLVAQYVAEGPQGRAWLDAAVGALASRHSRKTIASWRALLDAGDVETLAAELMARHYDPAYGRVAARDSRPVIAEIALRGLAEADLQSAAERAAQLIEASR